MTTLGRLGRIFSPSPPSSGGGQRKLGIVTSLIIGFTAMGVVLGIALAIAFQAGFAVEHSLQRMSQKTVPKWSASYEASLQVGTIARSLRDAILVEMQEELPEQLEKVKLAQTQIDRLMRELDAASEDADEKQLLALVKSKELAYRANRDQFIYQLEGGARGPARGMLTGVLRVSQADYLKALDDFRSDQSKRMQLASDDARAAMSTMTKRMVASFLVVTLLGLAVAIALVVMLRRRLGAEPHLVALAMHKVAEGDLSTPLAGTKAPAGSVIDSMRDMVASLREAVIEVRAASASVASQSELLVSESQSLSHRTEQQSAELEQAAAALEEFAATMGQSRQSVVDAESLAKESKITAEQSQGIVDDAVEKMRAVASFGTRIAETTGVIDSISFQTNILALNAAVEAARAGERGAGFAVVASEVRSLALNSAESAKQVRELILTSNSQIDECRSMINKAQKESSEVIKSVSEFVTFMERVLVANSEQNIGIQQLTEVLTKIDQFTQKNAALVNESLSGSEKLHEQSTRLVNAVARFKVESSS